MKAEDPWSLLRTGAARRGIEHLRETYEADDASSVMELGIAYLWTGDFSAACTHFNHAIRSYSDGISSFYAMLGTAKWCLNERTEAVAVWRAALGAEFQDPADVSLPLLLFFASVVQVGLVSESEVLPILRDRCASARIAIWPGPVAKYILNLIDVEQLRAEAFGLDEMGRLNRGWRAEFYIGLESLAQGNEDVYMKSMKATADTSTPAWRDEKFFFTSIWSPEFFLARHEVGADPQAQDLGSRLKPFPKK